MGTGPFSVCLVVPKDDSDGLSYTTVAWGYDTAKQAFAAIPKLAEENNCDPEDLCVIRTYDPQEIADER
jgi:hypothetical protein